MTDPTDRVSKFEQNLGILSAPIAIAIVEVLLQATEPAQLVDQPRVDPRGRLPAERAAADVFGDREMKTEIQAALKRGYTLEDIAQSLKDNQFDVGVPTLRAYLYRKNRAGTTAVNKRGTRRKPAAARSAETATTPVRKAASAAVTMPAAEDL